MPVRILIVDDEPLVRTGLTAILDSAEDLTVIGHAGDGIEAIEMVRAHRPDVVFMDLQMPRMNGADATREIRALPQPPAIVVLTALNADDTCVNALNAGAASFVVKASSNEDLIRAARTATTDEPFYSPAAAVAMRSVLPPILDPGQRSAFEQLPLREKEIANLLRNGFTNEEIGVALHISQSTVKSSLNKTLVRLGITNRTQLAILAERVLR